MASPLDYDAKFVLIAINLEKATQADLDDLVSRVNRLITLNTKGGQISDQYILNKQIDKVIDEFFQKFVLNLQSASYDVTQVQVVNALNEVMPKLISSGLYIEGIQLYKDLASYSEDVTKRLMYNGWSGQPLGTRIKTLQEGTKKTVQNILENGVVEGKGAKQIAKSIEQYISPVSGEPTVSATEEYVKRFGKPPAQKTNGKTPGIPRGTTQYNAYRIARTETANAYRQSTLDFYEGRDWVKGYRWVLSGSHPGPDICDDYTKQIYESADDVPRTHPNCLCRVRPIVMTPAEMKELRFNYGQIGNPYRDAQGKFSNALLGKKLTQEDKAIQERLNNRPANLRAIEQATTNLSDSERLKLAKGDSGQAGLMLDKKKHDELLAKFKKMASGK